MLHIAPGNARGSDVALIKVSRSEMSCKRGQSSLLGLPSAADIMKRAACIMRGNAPCGIKGFNGLRAFGAWHFCAGAKMPNVSIAAYVPPGRCPGLWATIGLTARPNHLTSALHKLVRFQQTFAAPWERTEICFLARVTHYFPRKTLQPSTNSHNHL